MIHFHIGLDFGTYQSKACIFHVADNQHEFFRFQSSNSFFLPSTVFKLLNGKFGYGSQIMDEVEETYRYFKIASAEDEEFRAETFKNETLSGSRFYSLNEFKNYSPEFLSTIFLANMLFLIKDHYRRSIKYINTRGGLIGRLLGRQADVDEEIKFTVQLGIPTEWSQIKNIRRKRKFENILFLAEKLLDVYKTHSDFLMADSSELVGRVKALAVNVNFPNKEAFDEQLNSMGLSVYPETAAGLAFMIQTRQLGSDFYAAMDVGGGSTDISFFRVVDGRVVRYLASESYLMAANNVFQALSEDKQSLQALHRAQEMVINELSGELWKKNHALILALENLESSLGKNVYHLFGKRVFWFDRNMVSAYTEKSIILYGGGTRLPIVNEGEILIHDHGNRESLNITRTYLRKSTIDNYTQIVNILPNDDSWKDDFSMLVVALGLSYLKPDTAANWFEDSDYHRTDGDIPQLIPHPFNEDCYIYDVINRSWN